MYVFKSLEYIFIQRVTYHSFERLPLVQELRCEVGADVVEAGYSSI